MRKRVLLRESTPFGYCCEMYTKLLHRPETCTSGMSGNALLGQPQYFFSTTLHQPRVMLLGNDLPPLSDTSPSSRLLGLWAMRKRIAFIMAYTSLHL
jgi:hypothetical protein